MKQFYFKQLIHHKSFFSQFEYQTVFAHVLPFWVRVDKGIISMKRYSALPKAPALDCLMSYLEHSLVGGVTSLQRFSHSILQPQPTGEVFLLPDIFDYKEEWILMWLRKRIKLQDNTLIHGLVCHKVRVYRAMKGNFIHLRAQEQEFHHRM